MFIRRPRWTLPGSGHSLELLRRRTLVLTLLALGSCVLSAPPGESAHAASPAVPCALRAGATTAGVPAAGAPCWTEIDPYPFGTDGLPVDPSTTACRPFSGVGPGYTGDRTTCYLKVDSFAFRAWNRGLAATSPVSADPTATTPFGVWIFNGTRWLPDATFPGQSVCRGNTVLWAGKRDYWLVGSRSRNWPSICRFDGVNFEWQPLALPPQTVAKIPVLGNNKPRPGSINSGACRAWDDCSFFGDYGLVVHWDGVVLSDASPDFSENRNLWLRGSYTAAVARTGGGTPFALSVSNTGDVLKGQQVPARPDGSAPPQLFASTSAGFAPLAFAPPTATRSGDPYRTDLVAVDTDAQGRAWAAGDPVGYRGDQSLGDPNPTDRRDTAREVAPLIRISSSGERVACAGTPDGTFSYANTPDGADAYLWSSLSVIPGSGGTAWAGGQMRPGQIGVGLNDDASREPVLAAVSCDAPPATVRFRVPDPTADDQASPPLVPADRTGGVTSVAANAVNDAWAATGAGRLLPPLDPTGQFSNVVQRPRLYRLTDTKPPLAAAGDDDEPRPLVFEADPPIIVELPPDPEPAPAPVPAVTQPGATKVRRITIKAAVYAVRAKPSKPRHGKVSIVITFRVRRPVTIGAQALRRKTVVSSTGLKRFTGKRGRLVLKLDRRHWPTRIRFVSPKAAKPVAAPPAAPTTAGLPR